MELKIILIITGIFIIATGWLIQRGKYYILIAGYNSMTREEKEKFNW